jgi:hypothetical protein
METSTKRSLTHDMFPLMRTTVVNMLTGPTITDPLLLLQELHIRERRLHLDIMTNGGLLILLIHHTIAIIILTLTTPILIVVAGTNMMLQNREILKDGVEVVSLMIHAMRLRTEGGDNGMILVPPRHTRNLRLGHLLLLRMKAEDLTMINGLQKIFEVAHRTSRVRLDLK